jgi:glutamyl-tRNA reductase
MNIGIIGINFKTAPLSLHESIARSSLSLFQEMMPIPMVLLSTCNRTEIYFSSENLAQTKREIQERIEERIGISLEGLLYSYLNRDCFAHLCRVSSGLDSAIFLETEIARQVKLAYALSCKRSILPSVLHYVFQKSFKVAKCLRSSVLSLKKGTSIFSILWQMGEEEFLDLRQRNIFLVGYSETNRRLADFFEQKGSKNFTFCSRWPEKVVGYTAVGRDALSSWNEYDLIFCASQTDTFLIQGEGRKKHLIFDLSVPRNVDPRVEKGGVKLYNIEQINKQIAQNKDETQELLHQLETLLWENVSRLSSLYRDKISFTRLSAR